MTIQNDMSMSQLQSSTIGYQKGGRVKEQAENVPEEKIESTAQVTQDAPNPTQGHLFDTSI